MLNIPNYKNREYLFSNYVTKNKSMSIIADENNTKRKTIEYWITKFNIKKYHGGFKYTINEAKVKLSPEMAYIIGFVITDGHLNKKVNAIHISLIDKDVLEVILDYLECDKSIIKQKKTYVTNKVYELYLGNKVLFNFLNTYIPRGSKTFIVDIPIFKIEILNIMLLRGLIDGDGTIEFKRLKNGRLRIGIASKVAVTSYIKLIKVLYPNKNVRVYKRTVTSGKSFWSCECSFSLEDAVLLYEPYGHMALQRKRNIVKNVVDDIVRTYKMINYKKWR